VSVPHQGDRDPVGHTAGQAEGVAEDVAEGAGNAAKHLKAASGVSTRPSTVQGCSDLPTVTLLPSLSLARHSVR
jgi:hypothetical protein